jgi:hypothetical protein
MIQGLKPVRKDFYLNPVAILYLMAKQLIKVLIAGRAFGKSFVNGISIMVKVATMPRSRGLFVGATYTQILTNTLQAMKAAWAWFDYVEGVDYVVGKKPPAHFRTPYQKPDRYENVITWWNGTTVILASMDRPMLIRGGNNDWAITDEALTIKEDQYKQIVIPTVRGSHDILKDKPGHLGEEFTSTMPYGSMGAWLLEKEAEAKNPDNDTFFIEGTSWHNRQVVGDKALLKWKRTLPPLMYMIEVMNKRIRQFGALFYPGLKDSHWYTDSFEYTFIDNLGFDLGNTKRDSRWDKDCNPDLPINISHDWGAFNCITIDQEWRKDPWFDNRFTVRFINFMYVSHPLLFQDLAKQFCEYYQHHKKKIIFQYGDKSGNKQEANSKLTYFEAFRAILTRKGWTVIPQTLGDVGHLARHKLISEMHREEDYRLPILRYNANNCKDLRIALESTGMKDDKKDKRSEKNKRIRQEHATHGTDAHDYRLWWGYRSRVQEKQYLTEVSFGGR